MLITDLLHFGKLGGGDYKIEDMKIDPGEVKSVRYMSIPELKKIIKENPDSMSAGFIDSLQVYFTKKRL